jgi:5-methyltetrahydropteroyltriglutamate--homocysteine methyltransferase
VAVLAPGWLDHFIFNEYYKTEKNFCSSWPTHCARNTRLWWMPGSFYRSTTPGLPGRWDMMKPEPTVEAYRKFAQLRIDAINHALAGIPEERVRYHLCWGSWHGPHTHDLPLEHIIDLILQVKGADLLLRGRQCAARARMARMATGEIAGRQDPDAGGRQPCHQPRRASLARRRPDPALRRDRPPQERRRRHGLRSRRPARADLAWAKLRTLVEGVRLASQSLRA